MSVNTRIAKDAEITSIKEISIRTAWERFSEDQRRELDKEKWSQRMGGLFDMMIKKENHKLYVAENENHSFLGYLWIGEGTNTMTGTEHGYIYDIFVKEDHRRKGIGMMLMKRAEHYCKDKGYKEMLLMVSTNNQRARQLYIKQGFRVEQMYMKKRLT